jgi:hypothetical protein
MHLRKQPQSQLPGFVPRPFTNILHIETAPADRLFPMPSGDKPNPYTDNSIIEQQDYFGPKSVSYPPVRARYSDPEGPMAGTPNGINSIPRKSMPPRRQHNYSSETILHHNEALRSNLHKSSSSPIHPSPNGIKNGPSKEQVNNVRNTGGSLTVLPVPSPPSHQPQHFLGKVGRLALPGGPRIREAIAISYLSPSTSQVPTLRRPVQSLRDISRGGRINILSESLPIYLIRLTSGSILSSSQPLKDAVPAWIPVVKPETGPKSPRQPNTLIITTTGYAPRQLHHGLLESPIKTTDIPPTRHQSLLQKLSWIPSLTSSCQNSIQSATQNMKYQLHQVDIVILLERLLNRLKQGRLRSCQTAFPGGEQIKMKNTPTYIFMFPPTQMELNEVKYNTAALER